MIKCGAAQTLLGIDKNKFMAGGAGSDLVPKQMIAVYPNRLNIFTKDLVLAFRLKGCGPIIV